MHLYLVQNFKTKFFSRIKKKIVLAKKLVKILFSVHRVIKKDLIKIILYWIKYYKNFSENFHFLQKKDVTICLNLTPKFISQNI